MVSITSGIVHFYIPLFVHLNSIIYTSVKNIEIQLERDLLTQREYVFFMEQLEMVKGIERNEAEEFQDYEYELKRIQNRLEEEKEYLEKEEKEEAEDK